MAALGAARKSVTSKIALHLANILQVSYWFALLLVFPLAISPRAAAGLSPEEWLLRPKAFALCVALAIGILAIFLLYPRGRLSAIPRYLRRLPVALKLVLLLAPLTAISGLLNSDEPAIALIGSAGRFDGILIQCLWLGLALVSYVVVRRSAIPGAMLVGMLVTGSFIVGLWATLQVMHIQPLDVLGLHSIADGNPIATIGHRALTTAFVAMGLSALISWYSMASATSAAMIIGIALMAGFVVASEGRAGLVGAFGAWVLLAIVVAVRRLPKRSLIMASLALLMGTAAAVIIKPDGSRQVSTIAAATQGEDGSFKARYAYYWPIALRAIKEKPIFGWGIEGFSNAFWALSTPNEQYWIVRSHISRLSYPHVRITGTPIQYVKRSRLGVEAVKLFTVDRAHNWYLDNAVAFGLPYAVLFLVAIAAWAIAILRSGSIVAFSLGAACAALLIFSIAWFATLQLTPLFWVLMGASLASCSSNEAGASLLSMK